MHVCVCVHVRERNQNQSRFLNVHVQSRHSHFHYSTLAKSSHKAAQNQGEKKQTPAFNERSYSPI